MAGTQLHHFGALGSFQGDEFDEHNEIDPPDADDTDGASSPSDATSRDSHAPEPAPPERRPRWTDTLPKPADLLEGLNDAQRQAVVQRGGPLLVVAGAGSGKTRALTHRVAHLIATGDALPWEILAITFTNKAADEMRSRLIKLIGPVAERMWVSTFHAACVRILRAHADRLGYRKSFTIYDDVDSRRLIEQIMRDLNIDLKRIPSRSVQATISSAKAELVEPAKFQDNARNVFERRMAEVYTAYAQRLLDASAMDFDDLLMLVVKLFRTQPDVLAGYRTRFKYVLVDEYQDTNRAQNEIVLLLGAEHHNVTVVGDHDQAIYSFRKADIRNIMEFEHAFPDATVIALEQNYRSTKTILDAANAVIANNTTRVPKDLWTDGAQGAPINRFRAEDEYDEAAWLASEIDRLHRSGRASYGDIAVFYRTNAQSRVLEEELVRHNVSYKVVGGTRFYDRREVKDILAYLRVVTNPSDEVSARRIVNVPRRGIGDTSADRLAKWARDEHVSFADALDRAEEAGVSTRAAKGMQRLSALLTELRLMVEAGANPGAVLEAVVQRTGYGTELEAEDTLEAAGRLENLSELVGAASEYDNLDEFLESVALVADVDDMDEGATTRVSLMTMHTAKGLEFPVVFLVGMEDGVFPHLRSLDDPMQLEEERRLAYVGMTRAKRHLYVSHAWSRTLWGSTSHAIPSRFLSELPDELVKDVSSSASSRPDPLRALSAWSKRRARRAIGDLDGDFDGIDEVPDDDGHDPDPWGERGSGARRG